MVLTLAAGRIGLRGSMPRPALLVLEDGAAFAGEALTGSGTVGGEIVFNTSMTGYQEIATDPSYCGQIVTYTFPLNGNYGADPVARRVRQRPRSAIVAREITNYAYNRDVERNLARLALRTRRPGGDRRRHAGAHASHPRARARCAPSSRPTIPTSVRCARRAQRLPRMAGLDLASCGHLPRGVSRSPPRMPVGRSDLHVVALDFGVKRSILAYLAAAGCRVTVVPAATSARDVLKLDPDGVFLSNGPGDPAAVSYAIKTVEKLLGAGALFGICLGHQLLALALGMETYKLKFGHRGANHPVKDLRTGVVEITTQNHGFAVRAPEGVRPRAHPKASAHADGAPVVTHLNLNDGTVEGLASPARHAFSVQYHPEATPGPHDSLHLFERFRAEIAGFAAAKGRKPVATGAR